MITLKALLVVRRIVSWHILCMDKCVCVMNLFYTRVHAWFDATRFLLLHTHVTHTRVTRVCRLSCGSFVLYNAKNGG